MLPSRAARQGARPAGARRARGRRPARGGASRSISAASTWTTSAAATRSTRRARSSPRGASTRVVDLLPDARPLRHGARVRFHHGTTELLGAARGGVRTRRRAARGRDRPGALGVRAHPLRGAGGADARRSVHPPRVLAAGDDRRRRRARSAPAALADPDRRRARRASPARRAGEARSDSAVLAFVDERRGAGLPLDALVSRAGLSRGRRGRDGRPSGRRSAARRASAICSCRRAVAARPRPRRCSPR